MAHVFRKKTSELLTEIKNIDNHINGLKILEQKYIEDRKVMNVDTFVEDTLRKYAAIVSINIVFNLCISNKKLFGILKDACICGWRKDFQSFQRLQILLQV